jgi:hypothetical protein
MGWAVGVAAVAAALAAAAPSAAPPPGADNAVTVIGDSVLTGVLWYPAPRSILQEGLDVHFEVAVCRRLATPSCTFEGVQPPTLVELVAARGRGLGPTVVVVTGYNDREETFAAGVEQSVAALLRAGVKRILWATLHAARHPYVRMNDMLVAASRRHAELTILEWNVYSRSHPEWFQNDGIHLFPEGGIAMASFLHEAIIRALAEPPPLEVGPAALPAGVVGRRYRVRLVATGGTAPYRWTVSRGSLPAGLRLGDDGLISGTPTRPVRATVVLVASDARGRTARLREALVVRR